MSAGEYREGDAQRHILLEEVVPGSGKWTPVSTPASGGGGGGPLTDVQLRAAPVPVSNASLPLPSGASTSALQSSGNAILTAIGTLLTNPLVVTGAFYQATQPVSAASLPLPAGAATSALQTSGNASLTSIDTKLTSPLTVKSSNSTTPTQTSASVTSSSTSVLASNANRLGATVYNESTTTVYLKLGATASTTSYSTQLAAGDYYEMPFRYSGAVDAITVGSTAVLRVTELT